MLCTACLFGFSASLSHGQESEAGAGSGSAAEFQARIERLEISAGQRIELLTGRSALMEVNRPVRRVDVGEPRVAQATVLSPQQVMISGRGPGSTALILWDSDNGKIAYEVIVQLDLAPLRAAIVDTAPGSDVQVRTLGEKILLSGMVPDVDTEQRVVELAELFSKSVGETVTASGGQGPGPAPAGGLPTESLQQGAAPSSCSKSASVVNHLKVAGEHQVVLRCTVAEVSKSAVRALGINGWLAGDNIRDVFAVNQIGGINPVNIGAPGGQNIIQPGGLAFVTGDVGGNQGLSLLPSTNFSLGFPRVQMQLFFNALRENQLLRVLAEPNLVALSGQEASFLAGGEFASVTSSIAGTEIEWKEFGIRLRFTPTVIGRQMIRLRVAPEVSDLDPTTAINTPEVKIPGGVVTRRAETTIELASGSTIAIAGLLSERVRGTAQKLPGLGDVPVLGALFSSVRYQKDITELVILVTPETVSSLQPDQVDAVPGQFKRDPNDFQLFGLGMLEGEPACEVDDPAGALQTRTPPRYPKYSSPPDQMTLHGPWGPADGGEATH